MGLSCFFTYYHQLLVNLWLLGPLLGFSQTYENKQYWLLKLFPGSQGSPDWFQGAESGSLVV